MPRRRSKNILMIGSGPSQIGFDTEVETAAAQLINTFAELDYNLFFASSDANSTIAQLKNVKFIIADQEVNGIIKVIKEYNIDTLMPLVGGNIALQLVEQLSESGILADLNIRILGITTKTIHNLQNPELMNRVLKHIKQPNIPTTVVDNSKAAITFAKRVGYPVVLKPIASLTKTNRVRCENEHQMLEFLESSLMVSSTHQVVIEKSIVGYKEIELTVIRDAEGNKLLINGAENFNPVGVHAGDSITVSPVQTLTDSEFQKLRTAALSIAEIFKVRGVCHVQFALEPATGSYFITRVNPFFDRTTAFASRATGYPIARVASQILVGKSLRDIDLPNENNQPYLALLEPSLDHIVVRFPTWSFGSIKNADQSLDTRTKSTGAVMAIGRSFEEALQKAIRSVDSATASEEAALDESALTEAQLINVLVHPRAGEVFYLLEALRRGYTIDELAEMTKIDAFYFYKLAHLVQIEKDLRNNPFDTGVLKNAKYFGLGDTQIARLWKVHSDEVRAFRLNAAKVFPTYKIVEPTAGEFAYQSAMYYSTFEDEDENEPLVGRKVFILGTANNQIGTNGAAEFLTVQSILQAKKMGYKVVLINNNPNAATLAPSLADKVYLEPLTVENCLNIIAIEQPDKILAQGKWDIVNRLLEHDIPIIQLPVSRTTRAENVDGDYMLVVNVKGSQFEPIGAVKLDNGNLIYPVLNYSNILSKVEPLIKLETERTDHHGIYTVIVKSDEIQDFAIESFVPIAVQDLPFLSFVLSCNLGKLLTANRLSSKFICARKSKIKAEGTYSYHHEYPYKQLALETPQNPPYSLAIGAKIKRLE